ncbi:MAG: hypothetical protein II547_00135 [Treponema sp.]|nr:hypothetical protein [Treponema sp.]
MREVVSEQMTDEEIKKLKELSKKYKGCRCSQYCSVWNSEDRDCEIMGEHHLSPSRCRWFLMQELRREIENDV